MIKHYESLGLSDVTDYDKFNHFAITHHSTQLEGSTLTETETQLLLNEDLTPKGKPLMQSLMVKDHYQALQFVLNSAVEHRSITPDFIKAINAAILKNTGAVYNTLMGTVDSSQGEYRQGNIRAGNRYFATYNKVPALTQLLCQKLEEALLQVAAYSDRFDPTNPIWSDPLIPEV